MPLTAQKGTATAEIGREVRTVSERADVRHSSPSSLATVRIGSAPISLPFRYLTPPSLAPISWEKRRRLLQS